MLPHSPVLPFLSVRSRVFTPVCGSISGFLSSQTVLQGLCTFFDCRVTYIHLSALNLSAVSSSKTHRLGSRRVAGLSCCVELATEPVNSLQTVRCGDEFLLVQAGQLGSPFWALPFVLPHPKSAVQRCQGVELQTRLPRLMLCFTGEPCEHLLWALCSVRVYRSALFTPCL